MKKILITGASGFIGSFLVERALEEGYEVWAGVRKSSSRAYLQDGRIRTIELDFSDKRQLQAQVEQAGGWSYVIHNAGVTKCADPADFRRVNFIYTKNLVEALMESGCVPDKFVLMSSLSAHREGVHTQYGDSKLEAERFVQSVEGLPHVILCPTGVYGPRDRDYFLMLKMIRSGWDVAAGFEPQRLSFIYVKDLAKAAFLALESAVNGATYFVSDGATYSDKEFTALAKEALGRRRVIRLRVPLWALWAASVGAEAVGKWRHRAATLNRDKFEIMRHRDWGCDNGLLVRDLGFAPDYSLRRGLGEAVKWYCVNGWL
jgi:nucleoside-diphosphate-sugar epimerase